MTGTRQAFGLSGRSLSHADYERRNHRKVSVSIVAVILHFCLRL